ncbi:MULTISPECIES: ATP-dependent Clp protease adapter ClpS [unclassified Glutamicibacter]|uniref:ATP-dependent Clp protease adapter ClpS n=1 Tax=unclassified Glutamicibacter TaxID=2627139 RepID=UPI0021CA9DC9|nr:ATP-dependent Clp protease adapter ClpS [Glutamicibacter sp. M10]UXN31396.1 ATP-dependent Clp protease adapter ClpS [Glutamicibacter sp. M10]
MTAMPDVLPEIETAATNEKPWRLIVWNDPVNLMSYVSYVFRSYFGFSKEKAEQLMLQVHHDGFCMVRSGSREAIESDVQAMHGFGLNATMTQGA